jgi:TolB-like protein/DNA-binding winged helix-turn-helix (wHTH) protein
MDDPGLKSFIIDGWHVSPSEGVLSRGDEIVHLEPKVMEVLVYFAARPGEVITREMLERDVWHGALVGYDAITATVIKSRKALQDDAKQPHIITTIPKKGYKLIAPITFPEDERVKNASPEPTFNKPSGFRQLSFIAVLGFLVVGGVVWLASSYLPSSDAPLSDKPSIVVLPFTNLSDDPNQDYLSDGITEDLIIDLSQVSSIVVISRTSAFAYKDRTVDIKEVADELDTRFVLEGSVRKAGDQVRITANLIDTQTNHSIWAERYDRAYKEIFAVQDEVIHKIVNALAIELTLAEKERLGRTDTNNLAAYEMFLQGQQYFRLRTEEGNELARDAYQRAIEFDPEYARAYGALAIVLTHDYRRGWTETSLEEARTRTLELAKKAVVLDRSSPQVYWSLGYIYLFRKQFKEAATEVEQAIALSPNYADGYGLLAFISNWQGNAEQAIHHIEKAITLNPHYSFEYPWNLGLANYTLGQYTEAVEALQESLERNEQVFMPRLFLAAS